jgi:hypothetical protein
MFSANAMKALVLSLRQLVGDQLYHTIGDDPDKIRGELERPVFTMPLWAFDQVIVTPAGEEPPDLTEDHEGAGFYRSGRVNEFRRELAELELEPGPTFTFNFWGISRSLDDLRWKVKVPIPLVNEMDYNLLCGQPPVYMVLYDLKDDDTEKRHLDSRKQYIFKLAFWSSASLPSPLVMKRFVPLERLAGSGADDTSENCQKPQEFWSMLSCCTAGPSSSS